jgi:hypothetical protein
VSAGRSFYPVFYPRLFDRCAQLSELSVWALRRPIYGYASGSLRSAVACLFLEAAMRLALGARSLLEYPPHRTALIMKRLLTLAVSLALVSLSFAEEDDSSKEIRNTSVVESGTYQVTAKKVDPEEKEIYVTMEDGKVLELYFSDATKLTQGGKDVAFDALKNGQKLEVQVEKDGAKLKPMAVTILD